MKVINKMKSLVVIGFFATLVVSQNILALSDVSSATMISGSTDATVGVQERGIPSQNDPLGNGAQWIYESSRTAWPRGTTTIFVKKFVADCVNDGEVIIRASGRFEVWFNGERVNSGAGSQTYTFTVKILCGENTLEVRVTNRSTGSQSSVAFAVTQDPSGCYGCGGGNQFYNRDKCACECLTVHECIDPHRWFDYPSCACRCKFAARCTQEYFWNERSCECQCKPKWCPAGFVFNKQTCSCDAVVIQPPIPTCPQGQVYDPAKDACVCSEVKQCTMPFIWSEQICKCLNTCDYIEVCPEGKKWDFDVCGCVCAQTKKCPPTPNWIFHTDLCTCINTCDYVQICPSGKKWDIETCSCVCETVQECTFPFLWVDSVCQCINTCDFIEICPAGKKWDSTACKCVCEEKTCSFPTFLSPNTCQCQFFAISPPPPLPPPEVVAAPATEIIAP